MAFVAAAPDLTDLIVDFTLDPVGGAGGSFVPLSRLINTTAPLTGGGDLSADRTFALTTSPAGQTPVGVTRLITATSPLRIDGGASADLSANRTLSVLAFGAANAGVVPQTGGVGAGYYLDATGAWVAGTVVGVSSITATAPLVASAATGAVTLSANVAGILVGGIAPPTGGADSTKFLCATNPISWAVPGIGNFVRLQGSTPGTPDSGNWNVSGVGIAGTALVAGHTQTLGLGIVESITSSDSLYSWFTRRANLSFGLLLVQQRARGSIASPTATQDNDELGGFVATGYGNAYSGSLASGMTVKADGNGSTRQPAYINLITGDLTSIFHGRFSSAGARFESLLGSVPGNAIRALHTVDVQGTFGIKPKLFTTPVGGGVYNYTIVDTDPSVHIIDQSGQDTQVTLPSAVGRAGRRYTIIAADDAKDISVTGTGGQTINGISLYRLRRIGDSLTIFSDGSNWWTESRPISEDLSSSTSDYGTVANTVVETAITALLNPFGHYEEPNTGAVYKIRMGGKFSTTGTPTLRFKIKNTAGTTMADSGAITTPSGVTDAPWYIEFESIITDPNINYAGRILRAALHLGAASGVMTEYNMITTFGNPANGVLPASATAQWGTASASNTLTRTAMVTGMSPHTLSV